MHKMWINVLILAAVLLAACSPASPVAPATNATVEPMTAVVANPTATEAKVAQTPTSGGQSSTQTTPAATEDASAPKMQCQVVSMSPTQAPTDVTNFPPPQKDDYMLGSNPNATLTIIEYSDFECPFCAQFAPILEQFYKNHPNDVRVVFRYFPLPSHQLSEQSAAAAEAAGMQGKFWEMHDKLFAEQATWATMTPDQFTSWVEGQVSGLGLDKAKFTQDMKSKAVTDKVAAARQHGLDAAIPGTPFVRINGEVYQGPRDLATLDSLLTLYQLKDRQFTYCPPMQIDPKKQYTATLKTDKGDIVIQLYPDKAPMAVNSFVFLARQGWFNNVPFHRVLPDFVAQTGDPSGTGFGTPGYSFGDEVTDLKFDKEGVVGMANAGPGSNGSQFFITYKAVPQLDGKYTIFGQVIQGMDVAKKLTPRDPSQSGDLPKPDMIQSVTITEK